MRAGQKETPTFPRMKHLASKKDIYSDGYFYEMSSSPEPAKQLLYMYWIRRRGGRRRRAWVEVQWRGREEVEGALKPDKNKEAIIVYTQHSAMCHEPTILVSSLLPTCNIDHKKQTARTKTK